MRIQPVTNVTPAAACDVSRTARVTNPKTFQRALAMASALLFFTSLAGAAPPPKNSDCLECHADKSLTKKGTDGNEVSLFVDEKLFGASIHRTNTCVSCHADLTSKHPDDNV